ncbi:MAG: mandelate racemase/muconate lactonizing enzyme family protein [Anaerolineales bacterium]
MKITAIRTAILRVVGPCVFVKIDTDDGLTGLGECYPAAPASAMVETIAAMAEHLLGQDPRNINALHEKIRRFNLFTGAQGGTVITALSGVEMALWDLLGKSLGAPVYRLLGGKFRDRVRLYADTGAGAIDAAGQRLAGAEAVAPDRDAAMRAYSEGMARQALARGFGAIKADIDDKDHPAKRDAWNWTLTPPEIDSIVSRAAHIRAVIGDGVDFALDAHARFDAPSAIQLARELAPFKLMWLEEPVPPDSLEALARVRAACPVPICAGENVYTRFGLNALIQAGAVDVVMPDLARCGGISEGMRISGLADLSGLPFAPHNVCSPLGTMAMAHVCAAIPNFLILEFHALDLPHWEQFVTYAGGAVIQDGAVVLADAPGWGMELNDEVARQHLHSRLSRDYFGEAL